MAARHRVLICVWLLIFAASVIGWAGEVVELIVVPFFGAMVAAILTFRRTETVGDEPRLLGVLQRRRTYTVLVGSLLLSAAVAAVLCGRTLFVSRSVGFLALGTTNVLVLILAWRALVVPSARRAATAGLVAVCVQCFALALDVLVNMHVRLFGEHPETGIALLAALASVATGALTSFATLIAFGPDLPNRPGVPEARVVDGA